MSRGHSNFYTASLELVLPGHGDGKIGGLLAADSGGGEPLVHVHLHAGDDLVALVLKDEARMNGDVPGVTPAVIVQEFSEVLHVNLEVQVLQQLKDNHAAGIEGILLRVVEGGLQVCPQSEPPEPEGAAKVDDVAGVVAVVPLNDGIAQDLFLLVYKYTVSNLKVG